MPVTTSTCPATPDDGWSAERTGPPLFGGGVTVVVGGGTTAGAEAGGGMVVEEVAGGRMAGASGLVAGLLWGTDAEVECEVVLRPVVDEETTSAVTAATRPTDMTRRGRLRRRTRGALAVVPPPPDRAGAPVGSSAGRGEERPSTTVPPDWLPAVDWRERWAASAMAASARALGSLSEWWPSLPARTVRLRYSPAASGSRRRRRRNPPAAHHASVRRVRGVIRGGVPATTIPWRSQDAAPASGTPVGVRVRAHRRWCRSTSAPFPPGPEPALRPGDPDSSSRPG